MYEHKEPVKTVKPLFEERGNVTETMRVVGQNQRLESERTHSSGPQFQKTELKPLSYGDPPDAGVPEEAAKKGKKKLGALKKQEITRTHSDVQRTAFKSNMLDNANLDLKNEKFGKPFRSILKDIREYSKMDVTAGDRKAVRKESGLLAKIQEALRENMALLEQKEGKTADEKAEYDIMKMYAEYFALDTGGYLIVPAKESDTVKLEDKSKEPLIGTKKVTVKGKDGKYRKEEKPLKMRDAGKEPLFPHEPSVLDVVQGGLGDCYLLAVLSALADREPQQIKACMKDNGNTVTVRFFEKEIGEHDETIVQRFVTVSKMVPEGDKYAEGCLWVQMVERAYAASGLHKDGSVRYKDKKDWKPSYQDIAGGHCSDFMFTFTGKSAESDTIIQDSEKADVKKFGSNIGEKLILALGDRKTERGESGGVSMDETMADLFGIQHYSPDDSMELIALMNLLPKIFENMQDVQYKKGIRIMEDGKRAEESYISRIAPLEELINSAPLEAAMVETVQKLLGGNKSKEETEKYIRERLCEKIAAIQNTPYHHTPFSGKYRQTAVEQYERIEQAVKEGKLVTGGTYEFVPEGMKNASGKNAEHIVGGLAQKHAYTVLGVRTIGQDRFVKLRNPWGIGTRGYFQDTSTGKVENKRVDEGTEGVFLMELNEFMSTFAHVDYR